MEKQEFKGIVYFNGEPAPIHSFLWRPSEEPARGPKEYVTICEYDPSIFDKYPGDVKEIAVSFGSQDLVFFVKEYAPLSGHVGLGPNNEFITYSQVTFKVKLVMDIDPKKEIGAVANTTDGKVVTEDDVGIIIKEDDYSESKIEEVKSDNEVTEAD